jgi:hypothetical protein
MDNVLPLGGDGDEIDLLEEIERTFAIKLPRNLPHCHTVGDLHRVLLTLILHAERGKAGCLAANAYFTRNLAGLDAGVRGLRIGVDPAYNETGSDPEVIATVREALDRIGLAPPLAASPVWPTVCGLGLCYVASVACRTLRDNEGEGGGNKSMVAQAASASAS